MMPTWWNNLSSQSRALSRRERMLLVLACAALGWLVADAVLLAPQTRRLGQGERLLKQQSDEIKGLELALVERRKNRASSPAPARAGQDDTRRWQEQRDAGIGLLDGVRAGNDFEPVLAALLAQHDQVELQGLKTLPPRQIARNSELATMTGEPAAAGLSAAPVELVLRGDYPALVVFLLELERRCQGLYWVELKLQANYPLTTIRLQLHRLQRTG